MHTIVVGLNSKSANVELREKVYFSENLLEEAYHVLDSIPFIEGCVILSTCNRVEIYCSVKDIKLSSESLIDFISTFHNIDKAILVDQFYVKTCSDAVNHIFRVASSLDSMVVGEYQIQGQIRDAYQYSVENNHSDALLNKVFQNAIQIGKRVRTETNIGKGSVSIGSVAVDLLLIDNFSFAPKVLFVGAGKMALITAKNLSSRLKCDISITNRTTERAKIMAKQFNATVIPYTEKDATLIDFDVIIVSTSSDTSVITKETLLTQGFENKEKSTHIIDLSVPRNVDILVADINNITLSDVDAFEKVLEANIEKRKQSISETEIIIQQVTNDFFDWYAMQTIVPVMRSIKGELTEISLRTIKSHKTFMNTLDDNQQDVVKLMLKESSDKLIRIIMKNLKNVTGKDDLYSISETLQKTFNSHIDE